MPVDKAILWATKQTLDQNSAASYGEIYHCLLVRHSECEGGSKNRDMKQNEYPLAFRETKETFYSYFVSLN